MTILSFVDELCVLLFMAVAIVDTILNRNWRKYALFWITILIMSGYIVYSMTCVHYNKPAFIVLDGFLCMKPIVPFLVLSAVGPTLTVSDKLLFQRIALVNCAVSATILLTAYRLIFALGYHAMAFGVAIFISVLIYLFCAADSKGHIPHEKLLLVTIFLISGLLCRRSKYYGEFVLATFLMYVYRPGIFRHLNLKHAAVLMLLGAALIAVSYKKIIFHFVIGAGDIFDPNMEMAFARPMLYLTAGMIMIDYFPFGTGLASFASYPSQLNYSTLYYEYGLDKVYGLSPSYPDFIMDAYYPQLAQFGVVGVVLFFATFVYIYRRLLAKLKQNPTANKWQFITGVLVICFVMIESVGGTDFVKSSGMLGMSLLGIITAKSQSDPSSVQQDATESTDNSTMKTKMIKI